MASTPYTVTDDMSETVTIITTENEATTTALDLVTGAGKAAPEKEQFN